MMPPVTGMALLAWGDPDKVLRANCNGIQEIYELRKDKKRMKKIHKTGDKIRNMEPVKPFSFL